MSFTVYSHKFHTSFTYPFVKPNPLNHSEKEGKKGEFHKKSGGDKQLLIL